MKDGTIIAPVSKEKVAGPLGTMASFPKNSTLIPFPFTSRSPSVAKSSLSLSAWKHLLVATPKGMTFTPFASLCFLKMSVALLFPWPKARTFILYPFKAMVIPPSSQFPK
ncbi:hypothetical protein ES703_123148 [subsurface metagenome]